jgi:hypothetical protein
VVCSHWLNSEPAEDAAPAQEVDERSGNDDSEPIQQATQWSQQHPPVKNEPVLLDEQQQQQTNQPNQTNQQPEQQQQEQQQGDRDDDIVLLPIYCEVCGDRADLKRAYGGLTCGSCRIFFLRTITLRIEEKSDFVCSASKDCIINKRTRASCRYCRLQKCFAAGMLRQKVGMRGRRLKRATISQN